MLYQTHTLPNGLRIIHRLVASDISYSGLAVNTGTRDESQDEYGMAHFVEHMLFKGTTRRRAHHIANRMENVGGELNAYTTKEETFIYSAFLNTYFPRAIELLGDILFNSEFSENSIERERDVILDEINSYIDSPSELIFDDFENLVYKGHGLGHYILGTPDALMNFDTAKVKQFVTRQYNPSEIVFFFYGNTPFEKVLKHAEKYLSQKVSNGLMHNRTEPQKSEVRKEVISKDTSQTHVLLGCKTIDMFHEQRFALSMLNNILGGGSINSRLNTSLREKHGLVYNVESNTSLYTDTGLFSVYFACDPKYAAKCMKLIEREFARLRDVLLSSGQLVTAKRQLIGQFGISLENHENVALGMAKSYLHYKKHLSFNEILAHINSITSQQIQELASELLDYSQMSELRYI